MARKRTAPTPLPRKLWFLPGGLMLLAFILLIAGAAGVATAMLFGAIGAWLVVVGRHRRWKGAPEAGYLMAGIGVFILVLALWDRFTV